MNHKIGYVAAALVSLSVATPVAANELNFGFINPNFGGNPFNSAHLLNLADRQASATATGADPQQGGIGGGFGQPNGPTIIIPITPGSPTGPQIGNAVVDQIDTDTAN
jgi:hypothetical protein